MRIFVLGAGATGSLLARLLVRQGHQVTCGDRDLDRARRFLGKKSRIPVRQVNARNLWNIVKAARGSHLIVNACPAVLNKIVLRAALRVRAHYLDTASHLTDTPFQAEQLRFETRFRAKRRTAVINAGASPGLTNLLVARSADLLDGVEAVHIRLFESTDSDDPVSQWSPEAAFDEAVSRPGVYRHGRFHLGKRFGEREVFRFPPPIGPVGVVLAAQDEVVTLPRVLNMREMDVKIGGNDFERLRRWYRQGKLRKSHGPAANRFPQTPTPRQVARLLARGVLYHARFAAAVMVRGRKGERRAVIRWDANFPTLHQIRRHEVHASPIAWGTAHLAALFVKHFPRKLHGVRPPEALPARTRQAILAGARAYGIRIGKRVTLLKPLDDEE
ncbi:MAG: saccharopine dehydrogenase NADP-binding domain-containing protein [Betaproteobacteria bacterium]|nr:saccharopine dehydrogenase NADP-binding domain-containing protein [Betaproteobacteria bacterium]